ncbi:hypothetical protein WMF04_06295 [Sorangium sp. So ce260]|uniref:hypothetical protein n=1 Tax=Sorangium sp. So ce260 TaxID=3133291 RepID=UPI003F5DD107
MTSTNSSAAEAMDALEPDSGVRRSKPPSALHYECAPSRATADEWVVEAIDYHSEGEIYVALFSGPGAKERAEEYATWKNQQQAIA